MTAFHELNAQLESVDIKHFSLRFPIVHIGDGVFTEPHEISFRFSTFGLDYTAYRTGGDAKLYRELWFDGRYDELAAKINEHWSTVRHPNRELVAATVDGNLVGLMTNYNEIDHKTLTDKIESISLHEFVSRFDLDMLCLRIWMNVDVGDKHLVSFKVTNGHSGHVAFGYTTSFKTGEFEFDIPLKAKTRHLKTVGETLDNLNALFEAAKEMQITEVMRSISRLTVGTYLDHEFKTSTSPKIQELLESLVQNKEIDNMLETVVWLGEWTSKRGYKVAASTMIAKLMQNFLVD